MTDYMLAPKGTLAAKESVRAMLDAGELNAYRVRSNGTTRLVNLYPVGSTAREVAEWVYDLVDDGRSVESVAREIHVSVATVRRYLESLEITEQVEAGDWDDIWADTHGFAVPVASDEDDNPAPVGTADEPACATDDESTAPEDVEGMLASAWRRAKADEKAAVTEAGAVFS